MSGSQLSGVAPAAAIALGGGEPRLSVQEANQLILRHGLSRDLARAVVHEAVAAATGLSEAEETPLIANQVEVLGIRSEAELMPWLAARHWSYDDLRAMATRAERLRRWSRWRFQHDVEVSFLDRKDDLDRVVYALLRVGEREIAEELHLRLKAQEIGFAAAVRQFSIGPERETQGLVGPVALSATPPEIGARLRAGREGQLWPPVAIGEEWFVLRLERQLPAELDAATRERLVHDLFSRWVDSQVDALLQGEPLGAVPQPEEPVGR
jgi:parvulin-like peptidyl-prolyl isomerase